MDSNLLASIGYFTGINNVDPDVRIGAKPVNTPHGVKHAYPLSEALNVDIDNTYGLSTRQGYGQKLVSGTDVHSFWSNGDDWPCFYVDGETLFKLHKDYTTTTMVSGLKPFSRMSYAPWGNVKKIYMTNETYIGYYHNSIMNDIVDPNIQFKAPLPPGQKVAYFFGRLYVAKNNTLYISDSMCDHYDTRYGFRVFANRIDLLVAIDDGLYVSDGTITWFLEGLDPQESMRRFKVLDVGALPNTEVIINGQDMKEEDGIDYAMWLAPTGVILGGPKGAVKNLTIDSYYPPGAAIGRAIIRNVENTTHYVASIH